MRLIKSRAPGKIRVKADRSISLSLPLVLVHPRRYHALSFPSALRCPSFLSLSLSISAYNSDMNGRKKKNKERKKEKEAVFRLRGERKKISSETGWRDGGRIEANNFVLSPPRSAPPPSAKMLVSPNDCLSSLSPPSPSPGPR